MAADGKHPVGAGAEVPAERVEEECVRQRERKAEPFRASRGRILERQFTLFPPTPPLTLYPSHRHSLPYYYVMTHTVYLCV